MHVSKPKEIRFKNLSLSFSPEMEIYYRNETIKKYIRSYILCIFFLEIAYVSYSYFDYVNDSRLFSTSIIIRLLVVAPVNLLITLFVILRPSMISLDIAPVLIMNVNLLGITYIKYYSDFKDFEMTYLAAPLLMLVIPVNRNITFRSTILCCLSFSICFRLSLSVIESMIEADKASLTGLVDVSAIALSVGAYYREIDYRRFFLLALNEKKKNDELEKLSRIDSLTGALNRRAFDAALNAICEEKCESALIIFDVDFFKLYNDRYGHPAGDLVLKRIVSTAMAQVRSSRDLTARIGGEEFAIILKECSLEQGVHVAEAIRRDIFRLAIPHEARSDECFVTVSLGVAPMSAVSEWQPTKVFEMTDKKLYQAKSEGRNCVRPAPRASGLMDFTEISWSDTNSE